MAWNGSNNISVQFQHQCICDSRNGWWHHQTPTSGARSRDMITPHVTIGQWRELFAYYAYLQSNRTTETKEKCITAQRRKREKRVHIHTQNQMCRQRRYVIHLSIQSFFIPCCCCCWRSSSPHPSVSIFICEVLLTYCLLNDILLCC